MLFFWKTKRKKLPLEICSFHHPQSLQPSTLKVAHTALHYSSSNALRPSNLCSDAPSSHWDHKPTGLRHIHPLLLQIVSQGNAHLPPSRIQKTPNQGFWRSEVHCSTSTDSICQTGFRIVSIVMALVVAAYLGVFFQRFSPVHLTYLFVCIICLSCT